MKKLLMLLVVIAMAAPAMATDVQFEATTDGLTVTVSYVVTDGAVRGMALNVDADVDVEVVTVDSFFDVFMDAAYGDPENYALGDGTPIASQDVAGEIALPSNMFCISMGNLEGEVTAEQIVLTAAAAGTGELSINTLRGAIVDTEGAAVTSNLPIPLVWEAGGEVCRDKFDAATQTYYDSYVAAGKDPSVWCNQFQCYGDADNATEYVFMQGDFRVYNADLNALVANWKKLVADTDPAADFDHASEYVFMQGDFAVYNNDLNILVANWKALDTALTDCPSYLP